MSSQQDFARRVLDAFVAAGLYNDLEIGAAGGPSTTKLTQLRKVAAGASSMPEPRGDVHKRIDTAAGWQRGSSRRLWHHGEEPIAARTPELRQDWRDVINASTVLTEKEKRQLIADLARTTTPPTSPPPDTESGQTRASP